MSTNTYCRKMNVWSSGMDSRVAVRMRLKKK